MSLCWTSGLFLWPRCAGTSVSATVLQPSLKNAGRRSSSSRTSSETCVTSCFTERWETVVQREQECVCGLLLCTVRYQSSFFFYLRSVFFISRVCFLLLSDPFCVIYIILYIFIYFFACLFSVSPKDCVTSSDLRQLLCCRLLPADPSVPRRCALAPAGQALQLRLHPGGERRTGESGHQPTGGCKQFGQAQPDRPESPGRLLPNPAHPGGQPSRFRDQRHRTASWEPHHQKELDSHVDAVHRTEAGNRVSCWGQLKPKNRLIVTSAQTERQSLILHVVHLGSEAAEQQLRKPVPDLEQRNKSRAAGVSGGSTGRKHQEGKIRKKNHQSGLCGFLRWEFVF